MENNLATIIEWIRSMPPPSDKSVDYIVNHWLLVLQENGTPMQGLASMRNIVRKQAETNWKCIFALNIHLAVLEQITVRSAATAILKMLSIEDDCSDPQTAGLTTCQLAEES